MLNRELEHETKVVVLAARLPGLSVRRASVRDSDFKTTKLTHRFKPVFIKEMFCYNWKIGRDPGNLFRMNSLTEQIRLDSVRLVCVRV